MQLEKEKIHSHQVSFFLLLKQLWNK